MAKRSTTQAPSGAGTAEFDRLWTIRDVSDFLGIPVSTLHQWRYHGTGPAAYRVGKHLRYSPAAVRAWLDQHCSRDVSA